MARTAFDMHDYPDINSGKGLLRDLFNNLRSKLLHSEEHEVDIAEKVHRERFFRALGKEIPPLDAMRQLLREPEACRVLRIRQEAYEADLERLDPHK